MAYQADLIGAEWDFEGVHVAEETDPMQRQPDEASEKKHPVDLRNVILTAEHKVENAVRNVGQKVKTQPPPDIQQMEALGEWDHGVCDPELKDTPLQNHPMRPREVILKTERQVDGMV